MNYYEIGEQVWHNELDWFINGVHIHKYKLNDHTRLPDAAEIESIDITYDLISTRTDGYDANLGRPKYKQTFDVKEKDIYEEE